MTHNLGQSIKGAFPIAWQFLKGKSHARGVLVSMLEYIKSSKYSSKNPSSSCL